MLKKCLADGSDVQLALLNYRNTPRSDTIKSPSERLMSRTTRSTLPTAERKLRPKVTINVYSTLKDARLKQKYYADRQSKTAPEVRVGDKVRIQKNRRNWESATIVKKTTQPRSFIVQRTDGKELRRNTSHIRPTEAFMPVKTESNVIPEDAVEDTTTPAQLPQVVTQQPVNDQPETTATVVDNALPTTRYGRTIRPPLRYGQWVE